MCSFASSAIATFACLCFILSASLLKVFKIVVFRVRVPHRNVYYYRCPEHRKNYVMSFAFCFDQERDVYHFAYCYPYTYTRLQNYLDNLEMKGYPFFQRELLTSTIVSI